MRTRIIFYKHIRSNISKVQGNVFILKTIEKQVRYLHVLCYIDIPKYICVK